MADVVVIGAGIVGCAAAAFLAEGGAAVAVVDPHGVAAGASGRNSGVLQDPLDPALSAEFARSLELYRTLDGFTLRDEPDGILLLGRRDPAGIPVRAEAVDDAHELEPVVRPGIPAVRVNTGWAIGPKAATEAWWARAERAGATLHAEPVEAAKTLIATGAWTDGVTPLWGVTAGIGAHSTHVLEEAGVEAIAAGATGEIFSLVGGVLGSTFDRDEPDPAARVDDIVRHAQRFLTDVGEISWSRACPRPQTADGRPLERRMDERTWVCAGHGPWGISLGPAAAERAAREILSGD